MLQTGGPVTTAEWDRRVPAILENWFGGEEQGHAIADVLWGDVNPSGSLPVTFPRSDQPDADHLPRRPAAIPRGQRPDAVPGGRLHRLPRLPEVRPGTELAVRVGPLLHVVPILAASRSPAGRRRRAPVTCRCASPSPTPATGAGPRSPRSTSASCRRAPSTRRPGNSPAGRARRSIPGASQRVTVTLDRRALSYWDVGTHGWVTPSGRVRIVVGASSADTRLSSAITVG